MHRFEIMTPWIGTGSEQDSNRPELGDDHDIIKWSDTTGQPAENLHPNPNLYIIEGECSNAALTSIESDNKYFVLWSEQIIQEEI